MTENPDDWRTATDPSTGKTYWYHRRTRVSTWTRPDFWEEEQTMAPTIASAAPTATPALDAAAHRFREKEVDDPYALRFRPEGNGDERKLDELLSAIQSCSADQLSDNSQLLSDLVNFLFTSQPVQCRIRALKCIWKLSFSRIVSATVFQLCQSWANIWMFAARWEDSESVILLAAILSNLSIGPASSLVSTDCISWTAEKLEELIAKLTPTSENKVPKALSGDSALFLLNGVAMDWLIHLSQRGHSVSALLIITLACASLRDEKVFATAIKCNVLAGLQQIYISRGLEEDVKRKAKSCLQSLMSCSTYARDRVLDGFLEMAVTLAEIPVTNGPDPCIYTHEFNLQDENAAELWAQMRDNGDLDVVDKTPEVARLERLLLQRDVEWIPQAGTSWHLCSSILWARCPALHEIIQGFWEQGGGGLELSIDSTDQIVACICHFLHSGLLRAPSQLEDQFELLRVSTHLGMLSLQRAVEDFIGLSLTDENVDAVAALTNETEYPTLARHCASFQQSGKRPFSLRLLSERAPESASLKSAIYESLQDVSTLLRQTSVSNKGPSLADLAAADHGMYAFSPTADSVSTRATSQTYSSRPAEHSSARGHSAAAKSSSGASIPAAHVGTPKPGGIYGLLLQQQQYQATEVQPAISPLETSRMPGRVMSERDGVSKARKPDDKAKDRARKPHGSSVSDRIDALSLLDDSTDLGNPAICEYRPTMSLEPQKEKTEREKRWERMSQPKQSREPKVKGKDLRRSEQEADDNSDLEQVQTSMSTSELPSAKPHGQASVATPGKPSTRPAAPSGAKPSNPAPTAAKPVQATSALAKLPTQKRQPAVRASQESDEAVGENEETETSDAPPSNVRSSLALLKAKTVRGRRRGSLLNARDADLRQSEEFLSDSGSPWPKDGSSSALEATADFSAGAMTGVGRTGAASHPSQRNVSTAASNAAPSSNSLSTLLARRGDDAPQQQIRYKDEEEQDEDEERVEYDAYGTAEDREGYGEEEEGAGEDFGGYHANARGSSTRWPETGSSGRDSYGGGYDRSREEEEEEEVEDVEGKREPCPDCGRRFLPESLQRHLKICRKVFIAKRKVFDSAKMRIEAIPELQSIAKEQARKKRQGPTKAQSQQAARPEGASKWKAQSEAFRAAMRAMKTHEQASGDGSGRQLPPPEPFIDPSLIQCPHCQRRFNQKAAERHIPVCQNIIAKPSSLRKGAGQTASAASTPRTPVAGMKRGWQ